MELENSQKQIYQSLNGLRGIAILLVLLTHSEIGFTIGWVGVPVFFVLSGFLITNNLLELRSSKYYLRNFYLNRAFRIFPLYYLCFFISLAICIYGKYNFRHWKYFALYLQNWIFALKCWTADFLPYFGHTWTLAIEEQFYLVWPFCLLLIRKKKSMTILSVCIIVFSVLSKLFFAYKGVFCFNFLNTLSSCDYLISGALISILIEDNYLIPLIKWDYICYTSTSLIVIMILIGNIIDFERGNLVYVFFHISLCISIFFLIFSLVTLERSKYFGNLLVKILSSRPLVFVGKISYGLYLYHFFIFHWVNESSFFYIYSVNFTKVVKLIFEYVSSFLVAMLSFYIIEKPILSFKYRFIK